MCYDRFMQKHFSDDRTRPYVFIPVNVTQALRPNGDALAVVDVALFDQRPDVHRQLWRTTKGGTVWRQYQDRQAEPGPSGRTPRLTEQLLHVVGGWAPYSPSYAVNTDPLDCRRANAALAAHLPEARERIAMYRPNSVVSQLEGYAEAINDLRTHAEFYRAVSSRTRVARLTREQVLAILNATLTGPMQGQTAESITGYIEAEFGVLVHVQQVRQILTGLSLRQPDFDYAALKRQRPSPRERALERWKNRQK